MLWQRKVKTSFRRAVTQNEGSQKLRSQKLNQLHFRGLIVTFFVMPHFKPAFCHIYSHLKWFLHIYMSYKFRNA